MYDGSIFLHKTDSDFLTLAERCGFGADKQALLLEYRTHRSAHKTGKQGGGAVGALEQRWYASLDGAPDFTVYADPAYLCDLWLCWTAYSLKGLQALASEKAMASGSVVRYCGKVGKVLDLGCGCGITTAALCEMFKGASVTGTNLRDGFQYAAAEELGAERGFSMCDDFVQAGRADVVFASEYFEHVAAPIEHLHGLTCSAQPRFLLIANGFNGRAIGHFRSYEHLGKRYHAQQMSRMFGKALRMLGYRKVVTNVWNNRPALWTR